VVLHRVVIRQGALVGAQALVTSDTEVPAGAMALGVPAKIFPDRLAPGANLAAAQHYVANAHWYNGELRRLD
jgi:carbonic anhydrase/acetyltransferase-like protein (isoleucine patch superfamily)